MATDLKITDLDFEDIKANLKNYLKQQTVFTDYDFDGAGLNVILDVLAYNTHYNAMAAHLSLNEAFLDSAQIRGNAVSRARMLGYVPTSEQAPKAQIDMVINATDVPVLNRPASLTLKRGTRFSSTVTGLPYSFVSTEASNTTLDSTTYTFTDIKLAEGNYNSIKYRVDNDIEIQKHQIPHKNVDISTLRVRVQANEESTNFDVYTKFETLLNVDNSSRIFHIQENNAGFYEIYFGDGVIGTQPQNNNIVTIDYVHTSGPEANGAGKSIGAVGEFSLTDTVLSGSSETITTKIVASGGSEQEGLESIRYNAPITFSSQNRAVTTDDYRAIIKNNFSNIASINTWGGEDQAVPDYGKVFIAIRPNTAENLTAAEKTEIINTILKGKNVVSITPEIVNPNYSKLELDVFFKYNPNLTDRTSADLEAVVKDTLDDYSLNQLNRFDGIFRHSEVLRNIDKADPSIVNSTVIPYMFQTITPSTSLLNNFTLTFPGELFVPGSSTKSVIESSSFKLNGEDIFFNDEEIVGSTDRKIFAFKLVGDDKVIIINDCGTVSPSTGTVTLNNFTPDDTTAIRITVQPNSLDIAPKRDQILEIDGGRLTVTPEEDLIATAGSSGSIDYTTTSRFRR